VEVNDMADAQDREEPETRVIAIGGSADGLTGLTAILQALRQGLPAAVVITQHVRRGRTSLLPRLLARRCRLSVKEAAPHERLRPSVVYEYLAAMPNVTGGVHD
jgi:chemotaxis response regulator CheB